MIKEADGLNLRLLDWFGFDAMFTPFGNVVVRQGALDCRVLEHEYAHQCQQWRDGWLKFWFLICFYYVWYGYEHSPYEIEAREAEVNPNHPVFNAVRPCRHAYK